MVPDVRVGNRKGDLRFPADFMERLDYGIKGNPEYSDSAAFVERIRTEDDNLSDEEYFAMLDADIAGEK